MRILPSGTFRLLLVSLATFLLTPPLLGQQDASVRPAPRLPNGEVNFGAPPGEKGTWSRSDTRSMIPETDAQLALRDRGGRQNPPNPLNLKPLFSEVPFQPWARAVYADRQKNELEPHTRCKPSGVARQFLTPYGVEFVDLPELQRVFIFDVGGPHTYRTVFMDGRDHPRELTPSFYGHSIGWWDGDTLNVDTVGYNEAFWLDRRGLPHTEALHTLEKFTRVNQATVKYEVTVDDPGAYTAPWTTTFNLRRENGTELFEYVCQQANYAGELMVGDKTSVDRKTDIVP